MAWLSSLQRHLFCQLWALAASTTQCVPNGLADLWGVSELAARP